MRKSLLALGLLLAGCNSSPTDQHSVVDAGPDVITDAGSDATDASDTPDASDSGATCPTTLTGDNFDLLPPTPGPMVYNGGPVMADPVNVYFIWYGNWADAGAPSILEDMISNVSNSDWYQIVTTYYEWTPQLNNLDAGVGDSGTGGSGTGGTDAGVTQTLRYATDKVSFAKSIYVGYPMGNSITDTDMQALLEKTIISQTLPLDGNGVYFFLTSADVLQSTYFGSFCGNYCGYHDIHTVLDTDIKYAFVGDVTQCPDLCSLEPTYSGFGFTNSPNGDWSADGMSSPMLHELVETITDPSPTNDVAWQDQYQYENADKCAWTYGPFLYVTDNCSVANTNIGSRHYMIQQNWVMDQNGGHCGPNLSYVPQ